MTKWKVSLEIARLGRIFHVPQVSYLSTAVVLSNKELYPYFFRTVPSDTFQAKVLKKEESVTRKHFTHRP